MKGKTAMRCAKCGNDISMNSAECPWCSGKKRDQQEKCPFCGSTRIYAVKHTYDPGCGCLGLLLFSWVGLLLGFLNGGKIEMHCRDCGSKWPF